MDASGSEKCRMRREASFDMLRIHPHPAYAQVMGAGPLVGIKGAENKGAGNKGVGIKGVGNKGVGNKGVG